MIEISYTNFLPNNGSIELGTIRDMLRELFLAEDEIVLTDTNERFNSSQINELAEKITNPLVNAPH